MRRLWQTNNLIDTMPLFIRPTSPVRSFSRLLPAFLQVSLSLVLLASCVGPPKAPTVREPFWPWQGLTQKLIAVHVDRAAEAWDTLQNPAASRSEKKLAEAEYELALARMLKDWNRSQLPRKWESGSYFEAKERRYLVNLQPAPGHPEEVSPLMLDRLLLADEVKLARGSQPVIENGLGVPVVGQLVHSEKLAAQYPMMPLNGAFLTLTAVLEFDPVVEGKARACHLRLFNPLRKPQAEIAGRDQTLAANYTAPKELAMNNRFLKGFRLIGLLFPDKVLDESEIYRLELYDPKRIPVVFVHGLMSDPHIWYNTINAIYADPELRAHYQPWYFLYPTGMAVPATSWRLRTSLEQARARLDPEGDDPGMNNMVLVSHSMGGLLSRMQTIDSGDALWNAYFNCEAEKLTVSKGALERLKEMLRFQKQPYIKRLIFITVPHRGSQMADRGIVHRLTSLIRLPVDSVVLAKEIMTGNIDSLTPQMRDWGMFGFLSIGTLSPRHPYLEALNAQPISVPHHSIIGQVGKGLLADSSDRVVPYSSSHLKTGTEYVVPYHHGCVEKPEVIAEVTRRLKQHLRESGIAR
jgi:pimeloyl-ACP methyl ester carboxylesterase